MYRPIYFDLFNIVIGVKFLHFSFRVYNFLFIKIQVHQMLLHLSKCLCLLYLLWYDSFPNYLITKPFTNQNKESYTITNSTASYFYKNSQIPIQDFCADLAAKSISFIHIPPPIWTYCVVIRRGFWNHWTVPISIGFKRFQNMLGVGINQICPCFPQRVYNVINKSNLKN